MLKYYKPARDKHLNRGYFSYLTESVINLLSFKDNNQDIKYYHDLNQIPGYGIDNIFEICFSQDNEDYMDNTHQYNNIENNIIDIPNFNPYDLSNLTFEIRNKSEKIIKKYFKLNDTCENLFNQRLKLIDCAKTIGVHRRATDIHTHFPIIPLDKIFKEIDVYDFDNVFLMCDNKNDYLKFKEKYGDKLICYDTYTSNNDNNPFFKNGGNLQEDVNKHIIELVFGVTVFSNVKMFICTKSNLSTFAILSNSKLKYKILE